MPWNAYSYGSLRELAEGLSGKQASGRIRAIDPIHLTDGQKIDIDDGDTIYEFEIDTDAGGVGAGNVQVDTSSATTKALLATAIANAINGSAITITATANGEWVDLVHDTPGVVGNVPIVQSMEGGGDVPYTFDVQGMDGGTEEVVAGDIAAVMAESGRYTVLWRTVS